MQASVSRSDPDGLLIRFEVEAGRPIVQLEFDIEGDGEAAQTVTFPPARGSDGRYFRAFAFKPTVNGTFPVVITATDTSGRTGITRCVPGVTVTSGTP